MRCQLWWAKMSICEGDIELEIIDPYDPKCLGEAEYVYLCRRHTYLVIMDKEYS